MISEFLLNIVFNIATWFLDKLPVFEWNPDSSWLTFINSALSVVGYILPIDTIVAIGSLAITLAIVRLVVALPRTIWDMLPIA